MAFIIYLFLWHWSTLPSYTIAQLIQIYQRKLVRSPFESFIFAVSYTIYILQQSIYICISCMLSLLRGLLFFKIPKCFYAFLSIFQIVYPPSLDSKTQFSFIYARKQIKNKLPYILYGAVFFLYHMPMFFVSDICANIIFNIFQALFEMSSSCLFMIFELTAIWR